jgi:hypothetical protein
LPPESILPDDAAPWFYRTASGAEIDLVIEQGTRERIAVGIKRSTAPTVSKGFYQGCVYSETARCFIVYPGLESFSMP